MPSSTITTGKPVAAKKGKEPRFTSEQLKGPVRPRRRKIAEGVLRSRSQGAASAPRPRDPSRRDAFTDPPRLRGLVAGDSDFAGFKQLQADKWSRIETRMNKKLVAAMDAKAGTAETGGMGALKVEEAAAIAGYTGSDYRFINAMLRNGGTDSVDGLAKGQKYSPEQLLPYINCITSGLNKLPPARAEVVYRGTNLPNEVLDKYVPGAVVSDPAFMSSSSSQRVAFSGMAGAAAVHRFTIKQKSGKEVSALTHHVNESEILFLPGTPFRVVSRSGPDAKGVIDLELEEVTP